MLKKPMLGSFAVPNRPLSPRNRGVQGFSKPNRGPEASHGELFNSLMTSRKLKGVGYEESRALTNASYSPCASGEGDAPVWIARQAGPNPFAKFRPPLFA